MLGPSISSLLSNNISLDFFSVSVIEKLQKYYWKYLLA